MVLLAVDAQYVKVQLTKSFRWPLSATSVLSTHRYCWEHISNRPQHSMKVENTEILMTESRWFERGVKEASNIRGLNPSLNIDIETGRYEGLPENERICPVCENVVEDEFHVLCQCPLYTDLREEHYEFLIKEMDVNVHNLSKKEKLSLILSHSENSAIRASANSAVRF